MADWYGKMMDNAFQEYYERFRACNALSRENAVTRSELFPEGETMRDADAMHKMLSMNVVKRAGVGKFWLDEKRAADSKAVLRQRIVMIVVAIILAFVLVAVRKHFGI